MQHVIKEGLSHTVNNSIWGYCLESVIHNSQAVCLTFNPDVKTALLMALAWVSPVKNAIKKGTKCDIIKPLLGDSVSYSIINVCIKQVSFFLQEPADNK